MKPRSAVENIEKESTKCMLRSKKDILRFKIYLEKRYSLYKKQEIMVMHKDKEENSHHDSHYRARELAAFAAYDHHHLDGETFLQKQHSNLMLWKSKFLNIVIKIEFGTLITLGFPQATSLPGNILERVWQPSNQANNSDGYAIETTTKRDCFKETLKPPMVLESDARKLKDLKLSVSEIEVFELLVDNRIMNDLVIYNGLDKIADELLEE
ncbi:hypothetical protein WN51_11858 [Melipona quadrifasciata]|uniref:Uncharacterized protein n=1 Tax=Melipona quadrifasciata TaxID=166423 RepID=A0A0N0BHE9_9HYME|nr:hypothetical protein WN51_11858 [Melipona quadrifasciata]